jgi:hypothetical protein
MNSRTGAGLTCDRVIHRQTAEARVSAVQTQLAGSGRVDGMKKRLLISGLVLAALLLAFYGVIFGTGAD